MRPVDKGKAPDAEFEKYQDAEPYLEERLGPYCSFCESSGSSYCYGLCSGRYGSRRKNGNHQRRMRGYLLSGILPGFDSADNSIVSSGCDTINHHIHDSKNQETDSCAYCIHFCIFHVHEN